MKHCLNFYIVFFSKVDSSSFYDEMKFFFQCPVNKLFIKAFSLFAGTKFFLHVPSFLPSRFSNAQEPKVITRTKKQRKTFKLFIGRVYKLLLKRLRQCHENRTANLLAKPVPYNF